MSETEDERFRSRYGSSRRYGSSGSYGISSGDDDQSQQDESSVYPFKMQYTTAELEQERRPTDWQTAGEDFSPFASYGGVQTAETESEQEAEQPSDREFEFELFSNEAHDHEFEDFLSEMAAGAETKFLNHALETYGVSGELEQVLKHPSFENMFNTFYETTYGDGIRQVQKETEAFANYLQTGLQPEMEYEEAKRVIDSYQLTAEAEQFSVQTEQFGFFKRVFNKVKALAKGVIKTGLNLAKKGVGFVKNTLLAPMLRALKGVGSWIWQRLKGILRSILRFGLKFIPSELRGIATQAISSIREEETFTGEDEAQSTEVTAELELEEEDEDENLSYEAEEELFHSDEFQVAELERQFDRQVFNYAESEFQQQGIQTFPGAVAAEGFASEGTSAEGFSQGAEAEFNEALIYDDARSKFVNGLISDPSPNVPVLTEEFIMGIMAALRLVMRIPPVRRKVVGLIAGLVEKFLGKAVPIPQNLRTPLFRALASAGLKVLMLEAPQEVPADQNRLVAETIANITAEAVERVAALPESILEAEDQVLESNIQEAMLESIANNVPGEALSEEFVQRRRLPDGSNWVTRQGYKVLDKTCERVLYPRLASRIRTFRGVPLSDALMRYQKWDGKTPIRVRIRIFEAMPVGTRLARIARDYLGGANVNQIRQIHPLTARVAYRLMLEPKLAWGRRFRRKSRRAYPSRIRRFYTVEILGQHIPGPAGAAVTPSAPVALPTPIPGAPTGVRSAPPTPIPGAPTGVRSAPPTPIPGAPTGVRSNNIVIKLGQLDQLRVRIYFNALTVKEILGPAKTRNPVELERRIKELLISYGASSVRKLLERLKIPSPTAGGVSASLVNFVLRCIRKNTPGLLQKLGQLGSAQDGLTISFTAQMPTDFLRNLLKSPMSFEHLSKQLASISPSLDVLPGYKL